MFKLLPVNKEVSWAIILPRSKAAKESNFSVDSDSLYSIFIDIHSCIKNTSYY